MLKKFIIIWAILFCLVLPTTFMMGRASAKAELKQSTAEVMDKAVPYELYLNTEENPDYAFYADAIGYPNFYVYGDDIPEYSMECYVMSPMNWLPNTTKTFLEAGGILIVCNEDFQRMVNMLTRDSVNEHTSGVFFTSQVDKDRPYICLNYKKNGYVSSFTEIHEFAHYMDYLYGYSQSEEFKEYFQLYAAAYEPKSQVAENYEETSEKEFFAILIADVLQCWDISELNIPDDLLGYIRNVLLEIEGIDILQ